MKKMLPISLYANGPLGNHGCEALYRSIARLFHIEQVLTMEEQGLDSSMWQDIKVQPTFFRRIVMKRFFSLEWLVFRMIKLWNHKVYLYHLRGVRRLKNHIIPDHVYASIGGDNYCYRGHNRWLTAQNEIIKKLKGYTILLGCSIEPGLIDKTMLKDLSGFDLIIARESLTRDTLHNFGLKEVKLLPDPAFLLETEPCELPESFIPDMTLGLNISSFMIDGEKSPGLVLRSIRKLIRYILENTKMNVALIPHVVVSYSNDYDLMRPLYEEFSSTGRICLIPDMNCCALKYIIGKCRFMIAARTHACIAAYSQAVPTLALGYSCKARGIASDLFGTAENYVLDIHSVHNEDMILNQVIWLMNHEDAIRDHYKDHLEQYIAPVYRMSEVVEQHFAALTKA